MKNVRREEKAIKDLLYEQLIKREQWLRDLKQNLETSIQNAPLGNLKIINCRGVEQYYFDSAETRTSYPNGKYLRKSDLEFAGKLAQRNYDEKLLSEVEKQLKNIQNIIKKYEKQEIVQVEELYSVYDRMSPFRKKMVDSRIMSDEEYVNQWSAKIYSGKEFTEGQAEIYTEKKERVRSKSEKIIADMLYHNNIPYKYECPVILKGLGTIYPDFTCLRLTDRKTILWEHLGMMTDPIYCQKAMKKIDIYSKNGFIQGRDIIYTFESEKYSLNTISVENLISQIFIT